MSIQDQLWMISCVILVFLMQAGFACLETGLTRHKNSIHVAIKNISNFGICIITYWCVGYAIMFGSSIYGLFGTSSFFFDSKNFETSSTDPLIFFLYQLMFAGASVAIISGAVAERIKFSSYLIISFIFSFIIYPVIGHWVWSGIFPHQDMGWLRKIGFLDFAGSSVVHCTGGWVSLALVLVIGSRSGRFSDDKKGDRAIQGSSLPTAILGTLFLWVGWLGFNGGSTLAFNADVPRVLLCTILAPAAGMITALIFDRIRINYFRAESVMNGTLGGLVAITACSNIVTPQSSIIIGIFSGIIATLSEQLLIQWRIDDPVGAIPVHGFCGAWGILSVALFGDVAAFSGRTGLEQLGVQAIGLIFSFAWGFFVTFIIFKIVNIFFQLRVEPNEEIVGLNIAEHKASSEIVDVFYEMEKQARTGDLSTRLHEEPFTEAGQIARRYNAVLDRAELETEISNKLAQIADMARLDAEESRNLLNKKLNELQEYYKISVGRELKIVDLKKEVNELLERLGKPVKFNVDFSEEKKKEDQNNGEK